MDDSSRWAPRLKSVKFEFDSPAGEPSNGPGTPRDFVLESPLPHDIPDILRRLVSASSQHPAALGSEETTDRLPVTLDAALEVESGLSTEQEEFWKHRLAGAQPTRFPKLPGTPFDARPRSQIAAAACQVKTSIWESSIDLITFVTAAWAVVLSFQTDSKDLIMGLTVSGSSANAHPVRVSMDRQRRVADLWREAAAYTECIKSSKAHIHHVRSLSNDTREACSFQTAIDYRRTTDIPVESPAPWDCSFVLNCSANEAAEELALSAAFDERVISRESARSLLSDLEHILSQMLEPLAEGLQIKGLDAVSPANRQLMERLNRPLQPKRDYLLHRLIEDQVLQRPQAPAVEAWDGSLTYTQLNNQSNALAKHLIQLGVRPEATVPIIFEKSVLSIVAMLAVAKAGGAMVPMEPSLPLARLHLMTEEANASLAIASASCQGKLPAQVREIVLDDALLTRLQRDQTASHTSPSTDLRPDHALYVMFTSGTTGKPKGVVVTHSSFCSALDGYKDAIDLASPHRRVLQYASFAFDASIMEILPALTSGACVCVPSDADRLNGLAQCIVDFRVNWASLTPSVARILRHQEVPQLEVLCFVGEALPPDVLNEWADHVVALNAYGPAECSIVAVVSDPIPRGVESVPLGRSRGCSIWIVNEELDGLVPFDAVGEMVIEGPSVSRGYLGNEPKTAASFMQHAEFLKEERHPSARYYKTGDLGRLRPDGTLEYLGRKDTQIKINGQRTEVGEIEHHVKSYLESSLKHSSKHDTQHSFDVVVEMLQPETSGRKVLAAFVQVRQSPSLAADVLAMDDIILDEHDTRSRLILDISKGMNETMTKILPAYMVPKLILPCGSMPQSLSGKTDRKTLREVGNTMLQQQQLRQSTDSSKMLSAYACSDGIGRAVGHVYQATSMAPPEFGDNEGNPSSTGSEIWTNMKTSSESTEASSYAMPCSTDLTSMERILRKIWADVLKLPEDSILPEDNFADLGGDSIGSIKVVAESRRASIDMTVATIASNPVLRDLARACHQMNGEGEDGSRSEPVIAPFSLLRHTDVESLLDETADQCEVQPDMILDLYPCTDMQESLMAVHLSHPEGCIGRFIYKLGEDVNIPRFQKAWGDIWATSPILRTRFATTSTGPLQAIIGEPVRWLTSSDLEAYLKEDDATPMFPGSCLSRFALVSDEDKPTHFVWTMHHMLYDGWSVALVEQRFNALYHGTSVRPAADFRSFVAYKKRQDQHASREFWQQELVGVASSTFPAPPKQGHLPGARSTVKDHLELSQATGQRQMFGITMSTMIRAAWSLMIGHYSQTNDVLFGATLSGRNALVDCIDCIEGPTLTTVPIRLRLQPDSRVPEFLRQVHDRFRAMIPYEQTGIQNIRSISDDTRRGCEFQNLLVIQPDDDPAEHSEPLGKPLRRGEGTTTPVLCEVWIQKDGIDFGLDFDEDVLSRPKAAGALSMTKRALKQLLEISESSSTRLAELELQEAASSIQDTDSSIPRLWNEVGRPSTLHDLIFHASTCQGSNEAVCSSNDTLSYDDLNRLSSSLALHLLTLGVEKGEMLPLCFEKSIWTVVAILATLKAGAAFVPLDPSQPQARLQEITGQVEARFVLMSQLHAKSTDIGMSLAPIVVDSAFLESLPRAADEQLPDVSPDALAYVIFTSGSTGRPKGVMVSHAAYAASAYAYGEALHFPPRTRVLQFSAYTFDASLNEILTPLMLGGTVCVPSDGERMESLAAFMRQNETDWAILTPSVARLLVPSDVPNLKTLDLGGEAPDEPLLSRWFRAGVRVFNLYGPAEGGGTSTCQRYREGLDPRTIGVPMRCCAWIVQPDDHDKLAANGEAGELVIEGPMLATGYLKDPEKTAASFISSPKWAGVASNTNPRRMYKTGDLVFKNHEDALVYVGRKDLQVKIHGQRIELGDIEANLATCADVKRCAVLFPSTGPFQKQLTAVIEPRSELEGNDSTSNFRQISTAIRTELEGKVPAIQVPIHWVGMTTLAGEKKLLPLNSSGKVDRRQIVTQLEQFSMSDAEKLLDASEQAASPVSRSDPILEAEQPAYTLAEKIASFLAPRAHGGLAYGNGNQDDGRVAFEDVFLNASGLDSLNMMSLIYYISRQFRVTVSMPYLMNKTTSIRSLAQFISDSQKIASKTTVQTPSNHASSSVNIMAEIVRHDSIVSAAQKKGMAMTHAGKMAAARSNEALNVLLTGANGFIGTQILRQLLEHRKIGQVIAIVRGETDEAARGRAIDAAEKALWWTDFHEEKLQVWRGDLSQPHLGLDSAHWRTLEGGRKVDVVIHNGAAVHWGKDYAALEPANVRSTIELLRLAVTAPSTRFVYVTGGRQWLAHEHEEEVAKELSSPDAVGYSQTKFVAEAVIKRAVQRGSSRPNRLAIATPGLVIGTHTEGVANADDYIWRLAAACIRIGAYNAGEANAWVDLSDAAAMASTIIDTALNPEKAPGAVAQVKDGMTWQEFWAVLKGMGYQLEARDASEWLAAVRKALDAEKETHPLWPLAHMLEMMQGDEQPTNRRLEDGDTPLRLKVAVKKSAEFLGSVGSLPLPKIQVQNASKPRTPAAFFRSGR